MYNYFIWQIITDIIITNILSVFIRAVYSCLLDASKAFDKVHWGRLFKILIERKVSFLFIRLLLDSYLRQLTCVA